MTLVRTSVNKEKQNCNQGTDDATEIETKETNVVYTTYRNTLKHLRAVQNQKGSNSVQSNVGVPPRKVSSSQATRRRTVTIKEREELKTTLGFKATLGHYNQPTLKDTNI